MTSSSTNPNNAIIPQFISSYSEDVGEDYRQHRINYEEILRKAGNVHFVQGNLQEALALYTQAIEDEPTTQAYSNRALTYLLMGKPELAYLDACEALELDESNFKAQFRKAKALAQMGRHKSAIRALQKCAEMEENNKEVTELLEKENKYAEEDEERAEHRRPYRLGEPCNHPGLGCAAKSAHSPGAIKYYWTAKEKIWEQGEHTTLWEIIFDKMGISRRGVKKPDWIFTEFNKYTKGNVQISLLAKSTEAFQSTINNFSIAKKAFANHRLDIVPDSELSPLEGLRPRLMRFLDCFADQGFPIVHLNRHFRGLLAHPTIRNSPWLRLLSPRLGTAPYDLDEIMDWLHFMQNQNHKTIRHLQIMCSHEPKKIEETLAKKIYEHFRTDTRQAAFIVIFDPSIDFPAMGLRGQLPKFPIENKATNELLALAKISGDGLFSGFWALGRFSKKEVSGMPYNEKIVSATATPSKIYVYW